MKPADFEYVALDHLDAALGMLASRPSETRVLAGSQSLLPLLKARLVSPVTLIDLGRIEDLDRIELRNGALQLGAMIRQSRALESRLVRTHAPLPARALRLIGSPALRNRGTIGGGAAHAHPAGEIPAVLVALDATLNGSFASYPMPTFMEMPPVRIEHLCTPSPFTYRGVKGAGEGGRIGAPAAIASAIEDALAPLGVVVDQVPMTAERLLGRIKKAQAAERGANA